MTTLIPLYNIGEWTTVYYGRRHAGTPANTPLYQVAATLLAEVYLHPDQGYHHNDAC